jgi:hypothetical protein
MATEEVVGQDELVDNTEVEPTDDELDSAEDQEYVQQDDDDEVDDTDDSDSSDEDLETDDSDSDEDMEYFESEEEYLKQFEGLPDSLKSTDDVIKAYLATLPEMKKSQSTVQQIDALLKARGIPDGVQGLMSGQQLTQNTQTQVETPTEGETYFNASPFDSVLKEWKEQGMLADEGIENSYKSLAKFADQALAPFIKKIEATYTTLAKTAFENRSGYRELSWNTFKHPQKDAVSKEAIFKAMEVPGIDSFEKAMSFVALQNPDLFKSISKNAEEKGVKKGQKKLKRFGNIKRGKNQGGQKYDYKKYQNADGSWNDGKLDTLPDFGEKMMDAWLKENKPK